MPAKRRGDGTGRAPLPNEKIYDITVENSELPGLTPEPMIITNENALLIATNQNGSVSIMTTNHEVVAGIVWSQNQCACRQFISAMSSQPTNDR